MNNITSPNVSPRNDPAASGGAVTGVLHMAGSMAAFKLVWVACVVGAAKGLAWLGPVAFILSLSLHLAVFRQFRRDLTVVLMVALIGLLVDSVFAASGLLAYASPQPSADLAPIWIVAMWANFGLMLNHVLHWLYDRYLLALVFGLVGGPMAYIAGQALGGVTLGSTPLVSLVAVAVAWAIAVPVAVRICKSAGQTSVPASAVS